MPEIKSLVARWRSTLAEILVGREDVLDELEGHLWDEIERRIQAGDELDVAFHAATAKLGEPEAIALEFAKVPAPPVAWAPVRVIWAATVLMIGGIVMMLLPRFSRGGLDSLLAVHVAGITLGYFITLLVGCLAACYLLTRLFHEPVAGQRTTIRDAAMWLTTMAVALTVVGIAIGIYCPFPKTGWCWGLDSREVGGIAIVTWNVIILACLWAARRSSQILSLMVMEIAASIVVVLGWLAAARVGNHSYGFLNSIPMIVTLSAAWGVVGLTALVPAGCLRLRKA